MTLFLVSHTNPHKNTFFTFTFDYFWCFFALLGPIMASKAIGNNMLPLSGKKQRFKKNILLSIPSRQKGIHGWNEMRVSK